MSISTFKEDITRMFIWFCETDRAQRKAIYKQLREKSRREKKEKMLAKYYEKHPEKKLKPKVVKVSPEEAARMDAIVQRQIKAAQDFADLMDEIDGKGTPANQYLH